MRRLISHIFLLLAACIAIAACGGVDKGDYERQVRAELKRTNGVNPQDAGSTKQLGTAITNLSKIEPPGEVEKAHRELIDGLELLQQGLKAAPEAASAKESGKVVEQLAGESSAASHLATAKRLYEKEGYDVFVD